MVDMDLEVTAFTNGDPECGLWYSPSLQTGTPAFLFWIVMTEEPNHHKDVSARGHCETH